MAQINLDNYIELTDDKLKECIEISPVLIRRIVLDKIDKIESSKKHKNDVVFNTIELLAKRLDLIKDGKTIKKVSSKKKKKKNFLIQPISVTKENLMKFKEMAINFHLDKKPELLDPKSLQILSKTILNNSNPKITEKFEQILFQNIHKNPESAINHLYSVFTLKDEKEYEKSLAKAVHFLTQNTEKRDEDVIKYFCLLLPKPSTFFFEAIYNQISAGMENAQHFLDAFLDYALLRPLQRQKALNVLLVF
ncbi:hypothetical protein MHBO_002157, partial [Bonamia ostreae]